MDIKTEYIETRKTGRYSTLGKLSGIKGDIWFVLHGYGDTCDEFIRNFEGLAAGGNYIIAPEGLSRFYLKGTTGNTGSSWMTKTDRDNEISDYVGYLDRLYSKAAEPLLKNFSGRVNALGFSQGAATLSRWAAAGAKKLDRLIFWCGSLAEDVNYSAAETYKKAGVHLVFSSKDPYMPPELRKKQEELLSKAGVDFRTHVFDGVHEVNDVLLNAAGLA